MEDVATRLTHIYIDGVDRCILLIWTKSLWRTTMVYYGKIQRPSRMCFLAVTSKRRVLLCGKVCFVGLMVAVYTLSVGYLSFPTTAYFLPTMDTNQRDELYSLVTLLVNVLEKQKIGYFIIGGTLIGSYRHHDIIPWDDDADIIVNLTDRERLYDALISYKPDYGLYRQKTESDKPYLWKFFSTNGQKVPFQDFRWPLVDIFFWEENTTHVWNADPRFSSSKFSWPKSHVFPLRKRPLGPIEVNSPCDPHSIIAHTFKNISVCQSRISSHSPESGIGLSFMGGQRRPCHQLDSFTPRVNRTVSHGVTSEKLVISGRVVNTRTFPVMPCEKPG